MAENLLKLQKKLLKPIVFIGLMGAGKSEIGAMLAKTLGVEFYDSDMEIVSRAGLSIEKIFESKGEEEFRKLEKEVVCALLDHSSSVISLGGGAVTNDETVSLIKQKAICIWLDAPVDVLALRVGKAENRPLLKGRDTKTVLNELLEKRRPAYEKTADIVIDSAGQKREVLDKIIKEMAPYLSS